MKKLLFVLLLALFAFPAMAQDWSAGVESSLSDCVLSGRDCPEDDDVNSAAFDLQDGDDEPSSDEDDEDK